MNSHLRDNLNALKVANKITTSSKTTDTSFSNAETTVTSFSYTFDSGTTYVIEGSWGGMTMTDTAQYTVSLLIDINGTNYGTATIRPDPSTATQCGGSVRALVTGLSGTYTVALQALASASSGHAMKASATMPTVLTLQPVDVV
jgi:hypothetical protein